MPNSCVWLPNGWYSLLPALLTTLGWMAALFEDTCNYAIVSGDIVSSISALKVPYLEVGLQAYREPAFNIATNQWESVHTADCIVYPESHVTIDTPWAMARTFKFMALICGGGATFYLWISTCCRFSRGSWRCAGYEVAAACLFQILSFIWFQTQLCTDNHCALFYGSKADIAAASLWMISVFLLFGHYPAPPKQYREGDGIMHNDSNGSSSNSSNKSPASTGERRPRSPTTNVVEGSIGETKITPSPLIKSITRQHPDVEMAAGEDSGQERRHVRNDKIERMPLK